MANVRHKVWEPGVQHRCLLHTGVSWQVWAVFTHTSRCVLFPLLQTTQGDVHDVSPEVWDHCLLASFLRAELYCPELTTHLDMLRRYAYSDDGVLAPQTAGVNTSGGHTSGGGDRAGAGGKSDAGAKRASFSDAGASL